MLDLLHDPTQPFLPVRVSEERHEVLSSGSYNSLSQEVEPDSTEDMRMPLYGVKDSAIRLVFRGKKFPEVSTVLRLEGLAAEAVITSKREGEKLHLSLEVTFLERFHGEVLMQALNEMKCMETSHQRFFLAKRLLEEMQARGIEWTSNVVFFDSKYHLVCLSEMSHHYTLTGVITIAELLKKMEKLERENQIPVSTIHGWTVPDYAGQQMVETLGKMREKEKELKQKRELPSSG